MNPIVFAMRYPYAVMVGVVAVLIGSVLAATRLHADVFPPLNQPVIYVCQPYGGMSPAQMEGLLTNYYEFHFLYVNGVHHVESRNVQGMTLIKVYFHPGTDMGQAMAELVAAVNRSRFMMPPGTVPPFVARTRHRHRRDRVPRAQERHQVDQGHPGHRHPARAAAVRRACPACPARPRSAATSGRSS